MEFGIKDLEIIDSQPTPIGSQAKETAGRNPNSEIIQNSLILKELTQENEELQNKIKLTYRRLLLYETENNKLIEEKNKLFFENQNFVHINQMLTEKNNELLEQNLRAESTQKLLIEKASSLDSINKTQQAEIRRFSKFHTKIQEVVRPLVAKLKNQIEENKREIKIQTTINANVTKAFNELKQKTETQISGHLSTIQTLENEKNSLIATYEEQIHVFSKEILDLQAKIEEHEKEVSRLKKAVEFKNYFENEVIRFKRVHEEDQQKLNELIQKKSSLEARNIQLEEITKENETQMRSQGQKIEHLEASLDMTRNQLAKKIDEISQINERLLRLEKLNNQLSRDLSFKQS